MHGYFQLLKKYNIELQGDKTTPVVCILSGGLDSTILIYLLKRRYENVRAISFNYNQRHSFELECATKTCHKLNIHHAIIPFEFYGNIIKNVSALSSKGPKVPDNVEITKDVQPITYVPFRNTIFLSIALSYAESIGATYVFGGMQSQDLYQYWDCSQEYIDRFNFLISKNHKNKIEIQAPFSKLSKKEEILIGTELGVPFEDTWTCYRGPDENGLACGTCPSCSDRLYNFKAVNIKDPISIKV